ncbi:response regulator [Maridesulfovibrio sp.]|uniref:response regulator n=1 Tax=Maridesulfovibrio sp. TaxID=2795000 RepID=UPI002A18A9E9|nr:response regulator [Maridesulfovibrio sp.]
MESNVNKFSLLKDLSDEQMQNFVTIKAHCEKILDNSPRFKYFTLHGKDHIENLLNISNFIIDGGISLTQDEAYYLALSICLHDIGMVAPLNSLSDKDIFSGEQLSDLANTELKIRRHHHDLVGDYLADKVVFLSSLNISSASISLIVDICKNHRVVDLSQEQGFARRIGALLRLIDELDVGPGRAPIAVLENFYEEMGVIACWHWYKHVITQEWLVRDNVAYHTENGKNKILFKLIVRPNSSTSVEYWLRQSMRSINKVLIDEHVQRIIDSEWGVFIDVMPDHFRSKAMSLGDKWERIENIALSSGKKTIMLIDDEERKMHDMFLPLMDKYHIIYSPNAKDAAVKMNAVAIDLAIVDMQIGSGGLWALEETLNCKTTGVKVCEYIKENHPKTQIGILTGTRHKVEGLDKESLVFFLKKPVDPEVLERRIENVLS